MEELSLIFDIKCDLLSIRLLMMFALGALQLSISVLETD
jgi:hypothetical protein